MEVKVIRKIYDFLERAVESDSRVVLVYGGAGAGKSYTMAQFIIFELACATDARYKILITRKYNPSLRLTTMRVIKEILETAGIPYFEVKTEQLIIFPTGSEIYFRGMDDPEKIKSADFNFVWMEEATEFTVDDFRHLALRLRTPNNSKRKNKIFLTFNPVSRSLWIYKEFFQSQQDDVSILRATYRDNPFLNKDYVERLKKLKDEDKEYYLVYAEGVFADIGEIVYSNWIVDNNIPAEFEREVLGLDFGYNNPTAIVRIGVVGRELYVIEEFYRSWLTVDEIANVIKSNWRLPVFCDPSAPDRIEELRRAGIDAHASKKHRVLDGIDLVKRYRIHINPTCVNTLKEIESYSWKKDPKTGELLDEPVKFADHLMDAIRYAVCGMQTKTEIKTGKYVF